MSQRIPASPTGRDHDAVAARSQAMLAFVVTLLLISVPLLTSAQDAAGSADVKVAAKPRAVADAVDESSSDDAKSEDEKKVGDETSKEEKKDEKGDDEAKADEKAGEAKGTEAKAQAAVATQTKTSDDSGATADGDADADANAGASKPAKETKRMTPIFRMFDGTRISGMPKIDTIEVDTPYGLLRVPREDLVRIRFAREKDPQLQERIRQQIEKLQSEEFEIREAATESLLEFGTDALKQLREATKSDDEEVKNRAEKLVQEIEESEASTTLSENEAENPIKGTDDEVVTVRFVIRGRITQREYEVSSSYGNFQVDRKDIISIVFQKFSPTDQELNVPANYFAPQNNWYASKVTVQKGDRLQIEARGNIQLLNYGWTVGPDGTRNIGGNHFKNFPVASLVARVGTKGEPFLVGSRFQGKANASGKIMFALAYRGGNVSGSFNVKIQLTRQDEE